MRCLKSNKPRRLLRHRCSSAHPRRVRRDSRVHFVRAAGRICADGQGQVPGHSYNCAVGATGRMTWAEVGFGIGARTERAYSLSAWRARARRQRARRGTAGAVARARSG
jgi:hypothetical protein